MSPVEAARFAEHPWVRDAVALRRWDDEAKVVGNARDRSTNGRRWSGAVCRGEPARRRPGRRRARADARLETRRKAIERTYRFRISRRRWSSSTGWLRSPSGRIIIPT